jgi:hypothetical protein
LAAIRRPVARVDEEVPMEWITAVSQLLGHLAWPAVLITFVFMFRHEIRQRLTAVTEVKYPGGSIIMREVERLEAKVEDAAAVSPSRQLPQGPAVASVAARHSDSRLAIGQMRLNTERELFLLSRHALHRADVAGWLATRYIEELEKARILDASVVDNVRDFVCLANQIVHDAAIPDGIVQRAAAVGSSLVATLHHKRLVLETERDFEGHGLWHMHARDEERDEKYYIWSAVAASLPKFDYDYDIYREAAERYNQKVASRVGPYWLGWTDSARASSSLGSRRGSNANASRIGDLPASTLGGTACWIGVGLGSSYRSPAGVGVRARRMTSR